MMTVSFFLSNSYPFYFYFLLYSASEDNAVLTEVVMVGLSVLFFILRDYFLYVIITSRNILFGRNCFLDKGKFSSFLVL